MERAGAALAAEASALTPEGPVVVVAGKGNNGGDGWVAARLLREAGREVSVVSCAIPGELPSPADEAAETAVSAGVPWVHAADQGAVAIALGDAAVAIDALLGIGGTGAPREPTSELIEALADAGVPVVSADVPSGVDADTGAVPGVAVEARSTVTFGALKRGLVLEPGAAHAGEVVVADIGLGEPETAGALEVWQWEEYSGLMPRPVSSDHKGSRGRLLVAGGSEGLLGAVVLACSAALRAGAGYVTAAVPAPYVSALEGALTCAVKVATPWEDGGPGAGWAEAISEAAARADAVVLGNGAGRDPRTAEAVRGLVSGIRVPLVLDADGLHALGDDLGPLRERTEPCVITPHAAEAARLLGCDTAEVLGDRVEAARRLSGGPVTCLLKGPRSLIAGEGRTVVNMTGGPGLATAGTGDVLAGIVGTLLAQGLSALDAAVLGTYLHGMAGDAAADALTPVCCTASDVITYLPNAVRALIGATGPSDPGFGGCDP